MDEDKIVSQEDEKQPEVVSSEDEKTETPAEETAEKQTEEELSPYKKELAQLAVENRQKDGALKEERKKRKDLEERLEALEKKEESSKEEKPEKDIDKLIEDKFRAQRFEDKLSQLTSNEDERKLVKHHYENSIRKTGDLELDFTNAVAIANKHLVDQAKKAERERLENEAFNARFSAGRSYSKEGKPGVLSDPIKREANELLKKLGVTDGEKYL